MENKFDDIRPYTDQEIPDAMKRITENVGFPLLASYVFPDKPIEEVRELLLSFNTIYDFQRGVMHQANDQIIAKSITEFTFSGVEQLRPDQNYLYISNHRDIMLDASLLQNVLVDAGLDTAEITFGANLMRSPLVVDIGKSNKMFRVERPGGSIKEFYMKSLYLSEYIRHVIADKQQSVWIAQRNGRTKDGIDQTDQGIIKMFCMSKCDNKIEALDQLNIVPVSVSYEWEPCDVRKAVELYESRNCNYIKKPGEDLTSILTGILQFKGRVHFQICPKIEKCELMRFNECTANEYHKQVAQLIDRRINAAYRLWPNNYIAYDMLYGQSRFKDEYTEAEKEAFIVANLHNLEKFNCDNEVVRDILLGIYANPVMSKLKNE